MIIGIIWKCMYIIKWMACNKSEISSIEVNFFFKNYDIKNSDKYERYLVNKKLHFCHKYTFIESITIKYVKTEWKETNVIFADCLILWFNYMWNIFSPYPIFPIQNKLQCRIDVILFGSYNILCTSCDVIPFCTLQNLFI